MRRKILQHFRIAFTKMVVVNTRESWDVIIYISPVAGIGSWLYGSLTVYTLIMNETITTIQNPSVFHLEVLLAIRFHGCFLMLKVSKRCPFHHLKGYHLNAQNWCFRCLYARTPASFSGYLFVYIIWLICASLLLQELETAGTFSEPHQFATETSKTSWWNNSSLTCTGTSYTWILGSYATSTGMTLKQHRRHAR